ncbi:alpha/beta-hydrolase [Atractiella rhizophila]|nr:alpha/beta-hydrolase [Atractiella rhizophila]
MAYIDTNSQPFAELASAPSTSAKQKDHYKETDQVEHADIGRQRIFQDSSSPNDDEVPTSDPDRDHEIGRTHHTAHLQDPHPRRGAAARRPTPLFGGPAEDDIESRPLGTVDGNTNPPHVWEHNVRVHPQKPTFFDKCVTEGFQLGSFLGTSTFFLLYVVYATTVYIIHKLNPFHKLPPGPPIKGSEYEKRITGERFSARPEYYIRYWGYECELVEVETDDGFLVRLHHILPKRHKDGSAPSIKGTPVLIVHGILSSSTTFVVNEERSLAFYLLESGYDVWLGDIRGNFKMKHKTFSRLNPRYWSWSIKEIAIYDLPAMITHIYHHTGKKVAYVGHSQGTGTLFLSLTRGLRPDVGKMLRCFVALGPAVYAGPVLKQFPFNILRKFKSRKLWGVLMGEREFIPIMSLVAGYLLPSWAFGHLAMPVFLDLFDCSPQNWVPRQIPKMFRAVPVPNSSELLYYYMSTFSWKGCIFKTDHLEPWWDHNFPPLMIAYGKLDTLVLGEPLVQRIKEREPDVRLVKVVALENYDHLDLTWSVDAVERVFVHIKDTIEDSAP